MATKETIMNKEEVLNALLALWQECLKEHNQVPGDKDDMFAISKCFLSSTGSVKWTVSHEGHIAIYDGPKQFDSYEQAEDALIEFLCRIIKDECEAFIHVSEADREWLKMPRAHWHEIKFKLQKIKSAYDGCSCVI